jgi:D-3-phosphoglycerate dehydrogenase / 2-oxoglutarate reductase
LSTPTATPSTTLSAVTVDRPRVLVCDAIAPEGLELLQRHLEVDVRIGLSSAALAGVIAGYAGLVVRSQTKVTAEVVEAATCLRVIGRAGVGVDNIDVEAATRKGVIVVNSPMAVNAAAAEHALALMFALARQIPLADASLRAGRWERGAFTGIELRGKTLGVIGLGNIGSELASRAVALEMRVLGLDPYVSDEYANRLGITRADLPTLLKESDFISVHVPLTPATKGMIGERELAAAKPGVRIINCARGGIVDERALLKALDSGQAAGAGLDVFAQEPPIGNPLIGHPKVVATPHLGASTAEAQIGAALDVAEQVIAVLDGRPARFAVNVPAIRPEALATLRPYLELADRLGNVLAQLDVGPIERLVISYSGEAAELETTPLRAAVLHGLLREASPERVNLVNALLVARSRGLHVLERRSDEPTDDVTNLISITAEPDGAFFHTVAGTVINGQPHLVRINEYRVDIVASGGYVLLCHHVDRPGVIGAIGTLLGNRDVNISFMQVGRLNPRGEALMVLGLDEPISEDDELFHRILEVGAIRTAKLVRL